MRERIPFDAKQKSGTAPDGSIPIDIYGITGGGGGGADWGQIGGALADQTDLKTALDGKATSAQGAKADSAVQPAALAGYVPTSRTVAGKPLTADVALAAADVGAATTAQGAKADTAVQPAGLTKAAVGLGNVDNTADTAKPVSTAQQTALNLKAPLASPAFTGTPTGITKAHVGLGSVDNTSDANKPISTAQATALAGKVDGLHGISGLWGGTQAQYDAIGAPNPGIAYLITD